MSNVSAKLDLLKIGREAPSPAPARSGRLLLAAGAVAALGAAGALDRKSVV